MEQKVLTRQTLCHLWKIIKINLLGKKFSYLVLTDGVAENTLILGVQSSASSSEQAPNATVVRQSIAV